ncbi:uncharacterized protein LOC119363611 isoform X2 [Triticum dicoccoides]|uniref:uncharacterized protein LOC119363611 isoform X2 n=1 Tax=Triticum dicoccoides TaxID=85692 RepID=UPI00188E7BE9|nr:uncharacterized protein LOC119363611 isoform X2 [Triticum dicoccoides]
MLARAGRAAEQSRPAAEAVRVVAIGKTKPVSLLRQLRRELRPGVYHQGAAASRRYPVAFRRTLAEQQGTQEGAKEMLDQGMEALRAEEHIAADAGGRAGEPRIGGSADWCFYEEIGCHCLVFLCILVCL